MKNHSLVLTTSQKRRFYSQELFDDQLHLKKYLRLVIILVGVFELIRVYIVESQKKTIIIENYQRWISSVITTLGGVFFIATTFQFIEKKHFGRVSLRGLLLFLSSISYSVGSFLRGYWTIKFVIMENDPEAWLDAFTVTVNLALGMALTDVIYPSCRLKLLLPCLVFIAMIVAIVEGGSTNQVILLFRIISISLSVIVLYIIKEQFRWKLFEKRIQDETWKTIQAKILDEIPTSIAVVDLKEAQIVYTNEEFKRWSQGINPYEAFKKVSNLNKRKPKEDLLKSMDFGSDFDNRSHPSINLEVLQDAEKKFRTIDDFLNDSPNREETVNSPLIMNLYDVLKELCMKHQKRFAKDLYGGAYDGVYSENPQTKASVEIKINFIAQYPTTAILMINDTTQRDLIVSLETNNRYKDNLLASISHELRTPLNGCLALLESAIQHQEEARQIKEDFLIPALRSGNLLVNIINDILDYSQLGSNAIRLALQDSSIVQTLRDCHDLMELQAKKKGLKFSLLLDSNIPPSFVTDHNRVKQILLNIISNAIKFTFEGEIKIEAQLTDQYLLNIAVTDTGIGIKEQDIEKIFSKYQIYQGEKVTKNSTGVGLGLTVARKLAKMLGPSDGQGIMITSQYGKGSTFAFNIHKKSINPRPSLNSLGELIDSPKAAFRVDNIETNSINEFSRDGLSPAAFLDGGMRYCLTPPRMTMFGRRNSLPNKFTAETEPSSPPTPQILIVDDDPFNILALEGLLKPFKFQLDFAFNGEEAIRKVTQRKESDDNPELNYKLVLMDFNMPIMGGHEATKILTGMMDNKVLPKIKIVGCTAFNTKNDIETGMQSGMSEVITKPVTKAKLMPILKRYLGISE